MIPPSKIMRMAMNNDIKVTNITFTLYGDLVITTVVTLFIVRWQQNTLVGVQVNNICRALHDNYPPLPTNTPIT